ncbi:hypothetical protein HS088_TW09G00233 [Tripterygium wilfordii]|uniref:Ubiquitin-like domain-containing protein n=1 Tax=Tripterygium wilfordii TaxID=458696 RepID=A0A7J7D7A4_TRIWF|nr:uncharacterized protein LOC120005465 [Tripterygium wilfordii]KAF5742191.1 hypothetical protein HS088_TW09G00233 [Tripterygium wilfordii]
MFSGQNTCIRLRSINICIESCLAWSSTSVLHLLLHLCEGMKITIHSLTGKKFTVEARINNFIGDVKLMIYEEERIPPWEMRLVYLGKQLEDCRTLADYGIYGGVIRYIPRLRGGADVVELAKIETYVLLAPLLQAFLVLFGSFRRRCHNWKLQLCLWIAYVLSTYLISYTTDMMLSVSFRNGLFPLWGALLFIMLGGADSMSAYNIDDNESGKIYNLDILLGLFSVIWLLAMYKNEMLKLPLCLFLLLIGIKCWERAQTFMSASKRYGLAKNTKVIADFMKYEHELSSHVAENDISMARYNYLVRGEDTERVTVVPPRYEKRLEITDKVVTISKIWQCQGSLFHRDNAQRDPAELLKDICLSFALFKLLCCRFAGYDLPEYSEEKSYRLIRFGLLSGIRTDYERPFRVIEVELAFLHDFFYTKYPTIFRRGLPYYKTFEIIILIAASLIVISNLKSYQPPDGYLSLPTVFGQTIDILVTFTVIVVISFIQTVELVFILFSDWTKVMLVCDYVQNPKWQNNKFIERVIKYICNRRLSKPWERMLGQYSLLESFDHDPNNFMYNFFTAAFIDIPRKGQIESDRIKLPDEVKRHILRSLALSRCKVSDGFMSSLGQHGGSDFSLVHDILVWHIATSLCEIESLKSDWRIGREADFLVATSLSKYRAYLVAFCPRLIPNHAYSTEFVFDQVVCEARDILRGRKSLSSRYRGMMRLAARGGQGETIMRKGALLGKHLIESFEQEWRRWEALAEVWTKKILLVATSDDETAHAEHLAKGGEFVTHLWALLYHASATKPDKATSNL